MALPNPTAPDKEPSLTLTLSEGGGSAASKQAAIPLAQIQALSSQETAAVLSRLPPQEKQPNVAGFSLRDSSLPVPRPGKTILTTFPPRVSSKAPDNQPEGPLEVVRVAPEGDIPIAANVSITFSQAMVPLATHADLELEALPVTMEPQIEGRWRWLGTKTLVFDKGIRLPGATNYRIRVGSDVTSYAGTAITEAREWQFSTPPVSVTSFSPSENRTWSTDPLLCLTFDQDIHPERVLPFISLQADNRKINVRAATAEEIAADPRSAQLAKGVGKNRILFAKPTAPLPGGKRVSAVIEKGLPSAEGPRLTNETQTFIFKVYGPLQVTGQRCGWGKVCRPRAPLTIMLSNQLDADLFSEEMVHIAPAVEGMDIRVWGNNIMLSGTTQARTEYKVTLDAGLRDIFGQRLERSKELVFKVAGDQARFTTSARGFSVLDPMGPPDFTVYSVNHQSFNLAIYKVGPEHWQAWTNAQRGRRDTAKTYPGEKLVDQRVSIDSVPDRLVETRIELAKHLDGGLGHLIVVVRPSRIEKRRPQDIAAWVQSTRIGLSALVDGDSLYAWANRLEDGTALDKVSFEVRDSNGKLHHRAPANRDGRLNWTMTSDTKLKLLIARSGDDLAILPERMYGGGNSSWKKRERGTRLLWHSFDDRGLYRPGESAHVKGWLRRLGSGKNSGLSLPEFTRATYRLVDSRGNSIANGEVDLSANGGFHVKLDLPSDMNLGTAQLYLKVGSEAVSAEAEYAHSLRLQEFRRPEFEVSVSVPEGPYLLGQQAEASVRAAYFSGGALGGAGVDWQIAAGEAHFTPPNQDGFQFGNPQPFWDIRHRQGQSETFNFEGQTSGDGTHSLQLSFEKMTQPVPRSLVLTAGVTDLNNQRFSGSAHTLVHPAEYYVGLRSNRYFVEKGTPFELETVVVDLDGKLVQGVQVSLAVTRQTWDHRGKTRQADAQQFTLNSGKQPMAFSFKTEHGGSYQIAAEIRDGSGRLNRTTVTRWVSGGSRPSQQRVGQDNIQLIPDKETYQPGDIAEILVQAPFTPARGLVTLRGDGIEETRDIVLDGATQTLRIPITEAHIPNLIVAVDLDGSAAREGSGGAVDEALPARPAFASGSIQLKVPPMRRGLEVVLEPHVRAAAPGEEVTLDIQVRSADGSPVNGAEVAVWVVDEAVLSLAGYDSGDMLKTFYPQRPDRVRSYNLRSYIQLSDPNNLGDGSARMDSIPLNDVSESSIAVQSMAMAPASPSRKRTARTQSARAEPIAVRTNFDALAAFFPEELSSNGRLSVKVTLPDNLTRYRILAMAVAGTDRFGKGESNLTARLPLMVRPSPPRFLNFGDRFNLPVILQNQTDADLAVSLAAEAHNAILSGGGQRVQVPANSRVRVLFPASADQPGTALFRVAAMSDAFADAATFEIPVWTPATTEAFATYGTLDEGSLAQAVRVPTDIHPQVGGLQVTTSSTALQALTDAVLYLANYPYAYCEPQASRILTLVALRPILPAFGAGIDTTRLDQALQADIAALVKLQNVDGGFGYWHRGERSSPYLSVHVAHALARARLADVAVPDETVQLLNRYLETIDRQFEDFYSEQTKHAISVYALWVQNLLGEATRGRADRLLADLPMDQISLESLGRLLVLVDGENRARVKRDLTNRANETAAAVSFSGNYDNDNWLMLYSERRDDAIILESLIQVDEHSDLIPKIVNGLMAGRVQGRWANTQENAFVLLALNRYFQAYENAEPDFVAHIWLGASYAGKQAFQGRTSDRQDLEIPMTWLVENALEPRLLLDKQGSGRLYYRLAMSYAPTDLKLEPASHGFYVERTYESLDDPEDVRRAEDGTWHIRAGANVRVRLTMVTTGRRNHVALVDPLPAGLEPMNPEIPTTLLTVSPIGKRRLPYWWYRPWYDHQNLRDNRAEAMAVNLRPGVHSFSYLARATTEGHFNVPPTKAEEMYTPETFGRGATDVVVVE